MIAQLEPCRYCGAPGQIIEAISHDEYEEITIKCVNCGVMLNHTQYFLMKQTNKTMTGEITYTRDGAYNYSAIDIWNGALLKNTV